MISAIGNRFNKASCDQGTTAAEFTYEEIKRDTLLGPTHLQQGPRVIGARSYIAIDPFFVALKTWFDTTPFADRQDFARAANTIHSGHLLCVLHHFVARTACC